jgi:hypothetical protein
MYCAFLKGGAKGVKHMLQKTVQTVKLKMYKVLRAPVLTSAYEELT